MTALRSWFDAAIARFAKVGADPSDDDETRLRKTLLVGLSILVWPISLTWATLFIALGSWTGWFAAIYLVISIASIILFARTGNASLLLRIQLLDILFSPTISMAPLGGFLGSGAVGLWGLLAPLGALVFNGARSGVRWYVAFVMLFLGSGIVGTVIGPIAPVPAWFANVILALNVVVGGTVFFALLAIFSKQREDALVGLRVEHERAESLLLNILPGSIAERLKAKPETIAEAFTAASVLFADVVDFTPHTERLPPRQVVEILDRLFGHFDDLAERYGLEKIKTIGDAYMVAAGVPDPRPDHARALALLALDMVDAVRPGGAVGDLGLELRIGLNSGPVVAGVIGRKRFLYDLWGDAVNTASRMESQGTSGRIQVTSATHELLRNEFTFEPRGTVAVKGKGEMETWYLVGRR
ncbi:MAG TPA: adenylate/guanylate cyclase domain-containing protein [Candidatus Limnocylindrales bacterium]